MDIQNALWKLNALADCSVLDQGSREAAKLAAEVLNTVRNLIDMGSGEDLAAISTEVCNLADQAASAEDKAMQINTLEHDNARRAQLLAQLLTHVEKQDVELNTAGVDFDEPALYGLAREWANPVDHATATVA